MSTDDTTLPPGWIPLLYTEEQDVPDGGSIAGQFDDLGAGRYRVMLVGIDPFDAADATWTPARGDDA